MIYVISDIPGKDPWSASSRDIREFSETARLEGHRVFEVPSDFSTCDGVENAFAYLPVPDEPTWCVLNGFIPSNERYQEIFEHLSAKNLRLINDPSEFQRALEFHKSYPLIEKLTARSLILSRRDEMDGAIAELGLPLFIKGSVRSLKHYGADACIAQTAEEAERIVDKLFELPFHARGAVILRTLLPLRHERVATNGFPLGREYRVFLYRNEVLAHGYYWEGDDALEGLSSQEQVGMLDVAKKASRLLDVPYLAIDVGQVESGEWFVIEPGDAQFAGFSKANVLKLFRRLTEELQKHSP